MSRGLEPSEAAEATVEAFLQELIRRCGGVKHFLVLQRSRDLSMEEIILITRALATVMPDAMGDPTFETVKLERPLTYNRLEGTIMNMLERWEMSGQHPVQRPSTPQSMGTVRLGYRTG